MCPKMAQLISGTCYQVYQVQTRTVHLLLPFRVAEREREMSSAAVPFWRSAGMTYITYSNICANLVRNCLKEPYKTEALTREKVHYSVSVWKDGKPEKPGIEFFFAFSILCDSNLTLLLLFLTLTFDLVFRAWLVVDQTRASGSRITLSLDFSLDSVGFGLVDSTASLTCAQFSNPITLLICYINC